MNNKTVATFFNKNEYQMIDISKKLITERTAIAQGKITVGKEAYVHIREKTLPKGDAIALAEIAGISAAKNAYKMIPLCHPLALNKVSIRVDYIDEDNSLLVYCLAAAEAKTGVEMEALAGVQAALLAIYDITKMIEPALCISDIKLLYKAGGKSGVWVNPTGICEELNNIISNLTIDNNNLQNISVVTITISDTASNDLTADISGPNLNRMLGKFGAKLLDYSVISDDIELIKEQVMSKINNYAPDLLITTGGTGLGPRDNTFSAMQEICGNAIPGIAEYIRSEGARYTKCSWLSRSFAGIINNTCVIALPGHPNAVNQSMDALIKILPHALKTIKGCRHD